MKLTRFISRAKIKDGKLILVNERYFRALLSRYDDTDKVRVIIEKDRGTRSKKQNAYYWGLVLPTIGAHVGELSEDLHEIMKSRFLRRKRVWRGGDITVLQTTTKLTTDEMAEYISQVIQEGAELGVVVPDPDPDLVARRQAS
jgi:hypothetical protein